MDISNGGGKKRKSDDDFVRTLDDDENEELFEDVEGECLEDDDEQMATVDDDVLDKTAEFKFEDDNKVALPWNFQPTIELMKKQTIASGSNQTSIQDKIQQRLNAKKFNKLENKKKKNEDGEEEDDDDEDEDEENDEAPNEDDEEEDTITTDEKKKNDSFKTLQSNRRRKQEIEEELPTFDELHLSRPLQKAIADLGFSMPTPIQAKTIPLALNGKDILASATTGSGKTAAFLLPILERLLYRDVEHRAIRVLVLLPTRELALQCQSVLGNLAKYSNITSCLVVGGLSNKVQEVELRKRPDVVIATPGRLIDHLLNAYDVGLDDLEILVLDEADRLLDMGFKDELEKIVDSCPSARQTMLFSATLSDEVKQLGKLSLNAPIRVAVDALYQVASTLEQEFVKIKPQALGDRPALLLSLATRVFNNGGTIVFFKSKKEVHRMRIIFGLAGLSAAELHGDLSQEQRFESLQQFRDGKVNFLLASDVAARGLDVLGVKVVINYNIPRNLAQYIHRVGRTARAGNEGRACSFVTDGDRKILKEIVSRAKAKAKSRTVSQESVKYWRNRIDEFAEDIKSIIKEELKEMDLRKAEKELAKAEKLLNEKKGAPVNPMDLDKQWFISKSDQAKAKEAWKIEAGILDPKTLAEAKAAKEEAVNKKKEARDPYAGLSRRKRRSKMHREELAREMAEEQQGSDDDGDDDVLASINGKRPKKPVDKELVDKEFRRMQNSQKASGKATKKIEALRRVGIYTGPTEQEKLKMDKKQSKKDAKKNKSGSKGPLNKQIRSTDFEKDINSISGGSSSFVKGKAQQAKKKRRLD
ncbi:hypothetical protein SAMD00019534_015760 [Acytostelium subglobosum LB1]|uniref:hypothetical protein n=1 Tax=Acytostelium subglobosum LB1 TaxID=1410327 RepID=UPI000644B03C|nr:hypothetical protein SAMD00019534_015760 [Acytostelium subglobosum LB1]GAM18401.1 hypothetical protein SAMD00019534_015760 [Acytostelium subglobosum LB1]|eukprot:XP_012757621.1 hypothetical protein SAMD00019534_015760 [Acytostelium subglobosum LB1]